ncbi:ABC transporter permease [Rhizobium lentis]|uniref:ABC transporter permease n=1 Tax=Rhizobium lentis TaxID=1138194 RepID=UPI001C840146|nr:ABC transporter permease [Rhizobium lentis]MBX5086776.1 ABC transporter permease [Rhizobium lentis]MBX5099421.1 ABC transporter permease [Rhizobium lentis]MBX5124338.1 ABC transporter permease [Rhizobium lentis]
MTLDNLISATSRTVVLFSVVLASAFLIVPLGVLALMSFSDSRFLIFPPPRLSLRWYVEYFSDPAWMQATTVSLSLAAIVSVVSTGIGLCAAVAFKRSKLAGLGALQAVMLSPLFVPTIIMAVGLYSVYSVLKLNGTMLGLVFGHLVLAIPYSMVTIGTALAEFDERLEQAAQGLGASPLRAFRHVTLPAISSGVITSLLFTFLISFDEVVLAVFLSSPTTSTISKLMWDGIRFDLNPTIAAVSTLITGFSWVIMFVGLLVKGAIDKRRKSLLASRSLEESAI